MPANAFVGRTAAPMDEELALELGPAKAAWDQAVAGLQKEFDLIGEWHSYSSKAGWALRLQSGKRNIVYLSPCKLRFLVSFALGDRAVEAARKSNLPQDTIRIIDAAKRYAEGTGVRLEVKRAKDLAVVRKLTAIKLQY